MQKDNVINLFDETSKSLDTVENLPDIIDGRPQYFRNYRNYGFNEAGSLRANPTSFKLSLNKIYKRYQEYCEKNQQSYTNERNEIQNQIQNLTSKKSLINNRINILNDIELKDLDKNIDDLKNEISEIKVDPKVINHEKPSKLNYYMGSFILFFLTIYLWIFYSSAIYSAFFREIKLTKNTVFNSIFYANSFVEAYNEGLTALVLTIVAPFIFIALGFLIHSFNARKQRLRFSAIILVTFLFDCILAFEITKKIYEAIMENSFTELPPYTLNIAISDVNFYLIIFAGFVVYLVWGFVLTFVIEEHNKNDYIKQAINNRQNKIDDYYSEKKIKYLEIDNSKTQLYAIDIQIQNLNNDFNKIYINKRELSKIIIDFTSGWYHFLVIGNHDKEKQHEIVNLFNQFCKNIDIEISGSHNEQNLI